MSRDRLEDAYRRTRYEADLGRETVTIRVGERCPRLDRLLAERGLEGWVYVTAWNPGSGPLPKEENAGRHESLLRRVRELDLESFPGFGRGDDGKWEPEASLLVLGVTERQAAELRDAFGQRAVVVGSRGKPARLLWAEEGDARSFS